MPITKSHIKTATGRLTYSYSMYYYIHFVCFILCHTSLIYSSIIIICKITRVIFYDYIAKKLNYFSFEIELPVGMYITVHASVILVGRSAAESRMNDYCYNILYSASLVYE